MRWNFFLGRESGDRKTSHSESKSEPMFAFTTIFTVLNMYVHL